VVSICPPHAAEAVAAAVADAGFRGLFVDANAIAPARMVGIGRRLADAGIDVVDGGVIGGPAWTPGTRLVLSGARAAEVAAAFAAGPLATEVLGPELGTASALKMAYASVTKGTTALLAAALAAAEGHGVGEALLRQWALDAPGRTTSAPCASGASPARPGASPARWRRSPPPSRPPASPAASTRPPPSCTGGWRASRARRSCPRSRRSSRRRCAARRPSRGRVRG
jgi:hypothetical protein